MSYCIVTQGNSEEVGDFLSSRDQITGSEEAERNTTKMRNFYKNEWHHKFKSKIVAFLICPIYQVTTRRKEIVIFTSNSPKQVSQCLRKL